MNTGVYMISLMLSTVFCGFTFKTARGISNGVSIGKKGHRHIMSWIVGPLDNFFSFKLKNSTNNVVAYVYVGNLNMMRLYGRFNSGINIDVKNNSKEFGVIFEKLKYKDEQKYTVQIVYILNHITYHPVQLKVTDGPEACNNMNVIQITKISTNVSLKAKVCGNPKPANAYWLIDDKKYSAGAPTTEHYTHSYIRAHAEETCGKKFSFVAVGGDGTKLLRIYNRSNFGFIPKKVQIVDSYFTKNCINVKWKRLNTGNCEIKYLITLSISDGTLMQFNKSSKENHFKYCLSTIYCPVKINISISLKAIYKRFVGKTSFLLFKEQQVIPEKIQILHSSFSGNCINIKWKRLNTENCKVKYLISLSISDGTLKNFYQSDDKNTYKYCFNNSYSLDKIIAHVGVRAVYGTFVGESSFTFLQPKIDKFPVVMVLTIVGAVTMGVLVLLLATYAKMRCLKRRFQERLKNNTLNRKKDDRVKETNVEERTNKQVTTNHEGNSNNDGNGYTYLTATPPAEYASLNNEEETEMQEMHDTTRTKLGKTEKDTIQLKKKKREKKKKKSKGIVGKEKTDQKVTIEYRSSHAAEYMSLKPILPAEYASLKNKDKTDQNIRLCEQV